MLSDAANTTAAASPAASPSPKDKKARAKKESSPPAEVTKFQSGKTVVIHRSELVKAPYNPREITPDAKRRLKEELKRNGYLDRIVHNVRTGFIVRGHQRLACLDSLEGGKNYLLEVTQVDMTEEQEVAANISGNNTQLHGSWDIPLLQKTLAEFKIPASAIGYSQHELSHYFGFSPAVQDMADLDKQIEQIEGFKQQNEKLVETTDSKDDPSFFIVLYEDKSKTKSLMVFEDYAARKAFTDALGVIDGRYHDLKSFRLKVVAAEEDDEWLGEGEVSEAERAAVE